MERFAPKTARTGSRADLFVAPRRTGDETARQLIDMRILELLTSRLCHELSAPIAAINNGMELLSDDDTGIPSLSHSAFTQDAGMLVADSARRARSRLQFYRFAYGFASGATIAGPAPHEIAVGFLPRTGSPSNIPRTSEHYRRIYRSSPATCSRLRASRCPAADVWSSVVSPLTVEAYGETAGLSVEAQHALLLATPILSLTARTVQPYFTGVLAKSLAMSIETVTGPGRVRLTATPTPS